MFLFHDPDEAEIRRFLDAQRDEPFAYDDVGMTQGEAPIGFVADHTRVMVGSGEADYIAAREAIDAWTPFDIEWVHLSPERAPIETGTTVAVVISHLGFYSINACRIVYTVDEARHVHRYGFAYGTLREHGERGEERFTVEWRRDVDTVWYDVLAYSRPTLFAALGYPYVRHLQRRFASASAARMQSLNSRG
jgi:uncharacterized protein (UPF0548 family)